MAQAAAYLPYVIMAIGQVASAYLGNKDNGGGDGGDGGGPSAYSAEGTPRSTRSSTTTSSSSSPATTSLALAAAPSSAGLSAWDPGNSSPWESGLYPNVSETPAPTDTGGGAGGGFDWAGFGMDFFRGAQGAGGSLQSMGQQRQATAVAQRTPVFGMQPSAYTGQAGPVINPGMTLLQALISKRLAA